MGIFDRLKGNKEQVRILDHPGKLAMGDIVKFGFNDLSGISNQEIIIKNILTYDVNPGSSPITACCFQAGGREYQLFSMPGVSNDTFAIALKVFPEDVESIFSIDEFAYILDEDSGDQHTLGRKNQPDQFSGWTSQRYVQEAGHEGYLHKGDFRDIALPDDKESCIPFSYYYLVSEDRKHAIQIEVYDGGRTEVFLIAYVPQRYIEEMWPA